jgi:hypothetical protein
LSKPPIAFKRVVFPEPEFPNSATNPLFSKVKEVLLIT